MAKQRSLHNLQACNTFMKDIVLIYAILERRRTTYKPACYVKFEG